MNISIWFGISPGFQRFYRKFNPTLFHWSTAFFQMVLENMQYKFMQNKNWIFLFGSEFPPSARHVIENQSKFFYIGLQRFFSSKGPRKYAVWVYVEKYLNIDILFRIFPRFQRWYWKCNPTLLHWATAFFLLKMVLKNTQFEFM